MRRYAEYAEQSAPGLERLPKHWAVAPVKHVVTCNDEVLGEDTAADHEIYYVEISGVSFGQGVTDIATLKFGDAPSRARRVVRSGDILVSTVRTYLKALALVEDAPANLVASTGFAVLRPRNIEPAFLGYVVSSDFFVGEVISRSVGVSYPAINSSDLIRISIPVPPLPEQRAIAAFLDRETGKIDALVAEQRRLIALLKEKRQAVISHAVTKGLDPTAPLKPSGIDWLGNIPAHWEVRAVRHLAKLESGHTPSRSRPDWWQDCYIPWFGLADVWQIRSGDVEYVKDTKEQVSDLGLENSSARLLPAGTVILSRTASVGYSAIMAVPMATTQDFANWICGDQLQPEYLLYCLRAMKSEFERLRYGSTHNTIYMPDISAFRIAVPPLEEQTAIVGHIRSKAGNLFTLTAEAERAIALLTERRAALISAAVTGKIDVRDTAATTNTEDAA